MTLEDTPKIVTPAGVAGLKFDDEAYAPRTAPASRRSAT